MKCLLNHWDHWWCRQTHPHALALARIAFGFFFLFYTGRYIFQIPLLFSHEGLALPLLGHITPESLLWLTTPPSVLVATILYGLLLLGCIGFALGYHMRISLIIVICLSLYFWQMQFHMFPATIHRISSLLLIVFLFSGADRTYSLYAKKKFGSWTAWEPVCILPQRLIALQISITYLGVGWQKLWLPAWDTGEIIPYALISSWGSPLAYWLVQQNLPLTFYDFSVFILKLFEFILPFALWIKPLRKWFMIGGAIMHILFFAFLTIWSFLVLIPLYVVFVDGKDLSDWWVRWGSNPRPRG